jgi:hypothetical protein
MATKNRVVLRSNFAAVKRAGHEAVQQARDRALDEGEDAAEQRLERANNSRGWNLPTDIEQEKTGFQSGLIRYDHFFGPWFEYGAVHLPASPFMRPAHRKMRKRFVDELDDNFEGWVRRKAGMRRR